MGGKSAIGVDLPNVFTGPTSVARARSRDVGRIVNGKIYARGLKLYGRVWGSGIEMGRRGVRSVVGLVKSVLGEMIGWPRETHL